MNQTVFNLECPKYTLAEWLNLSSTEKTLALFEARHDAGIEDEYVHYINKSMAYFDRFAEEAHKVVDAGFKHYSHVLIAHVVRHHSNIHDKDTLFKVNNNATPRVARMATALFPGLNGLFEFRELK